MRNAGAAVTSGGGVDPGDLERLVVIEGREDRRQSAGQHRLADAGRPDHQQVMRARRRDARARGVRCRARARRRGRAVRRLRVVRDTSGGGSGAIGPRRLALQTQRAARRACARRGSPTPRHERRFGRVRGRDDDVLDARPHRARRRARSCPPPVAPRRRARARRAPPHRRAPPPAARPPRTSTPARRRARAPRRSCAPTRARDSRSPAAAGTRARTTTAPPAPVPATPAPPHRAARRPCSPGRPRDTWTSTVTIRPSTPSSTALRTAASTVDPSLRNRLRKEGRDRDLDGEP